MKKRKEITATVCGAVLWRHAVRPSNETWRRESICGGIAFKTESMIKVSLKGVKKVYEKSVVAVHDFNLDIEDKEFIVLVGPSGCGKSTTLRMIAGLEEISEGELYIDGNVVNDAAPKDRDIAMVFQNYALYPHMTVYENMAFALKLRKKKKDVIDRKVKEAAEILGITDLLQRKPKALSGGQRQRVAIGRAIVREPQVFLMDEPLSNLDAKLRNQMRAELIKLRKRIDATFIYVTHDQTEAMTLGDRIVIMKDGLVQQIDTPVEVYNKPRNLFVAGFIGTPQMNFFHGRLVKAGERYSVTLGEGYPEVTISERMQKVLTEKEASKGKVILGIRPEHIKLAERAGADTFTGTITVSEMMGNEIYIHMDFLGTDTIMRVPTIGLPEEYQHGIIIEKKIYFQMPAPLIHVFDEETEVSVLC